MSHTSLFLQAATGQDTPRAPIWIMRQAGRYLPEYMKIKERYSFWDMARTPDLACEISLQPIRRFAMDAAILFQDIMTPLPPMGVKIDFAPGPVFAKPLRSAQAIDALSIPDKDEIAPFVAEAIKLVRSECPVPLIGFGGAPLTLATYMIEGGGSKDFETFRGFLRHEPQAAHRLLDKLTEVSIRYLTMQVESGAQAIQLFDSWAGLHGTELYRTFAKPYNQRIFEALAAYEIPRLYLAINAHHLYAEIRDLSCDVVSVDWRAPLGEVRTLLGGKTLQGNLDPAVLLSSEASITQEAEAVLLEGLGGAHVFNLGHGIMRQTNPDRLAHLVEVVKTFDRTQAAAKRSDSASIRTDI